MKIQLCYASTWSNINDDLLEDISNILVTSRVLNTETGITGVLYYSHGKFFQCLEGDQNKVNLLFEHISKDARHCKIKKYEESVIEENNFTGWSMKYVQKNSAIDSMFKNIGYKNFDPYIFDDKTLRKLLSVLYTAEATHKPNVIQGYKNRGYMAYL